MRLAMAQMSMLNSLNDNYKKSVRFIEAAMGNDLLFFPEIQLTPFFPRVSGLNADPALNKMDDTLISGFAFQARKNHIYLSPNVYLQEHGRKYDASLWFDKNGKSYEPAKMVHIASYPHFYEKEYYDPSDTGFIVHKTSIGNIGIVICYDRHFPESVRTCAVKGADLVIIPTANTKEEDMDLFEAEVRAEAYQNGVFIAMCNRVGKEGRMHFAGESVVVGPDGKVIARADDTEQLITVNLDLTQAKKEQAKRPYLNQRRKDMYA